MEPMYLSIRQKETRIRIKRLLKESGYTVRDVQSVMGFENPQAIYKWMSGRSLPNLDNLVILSRILHMSVEDILVIDGDVVLLWGLNCCYNDMEPRRHYDVFRRMKKESFLFGEELLEAVSAYMITKQCHAIILCREMEEVEYLHTRNRKIR